LSPRTTTMEVEPLMLLSIVDDFLRYLCTLIRAGLTPPDRSIRSSTNRTGAWEKSRNSSEVQTLNLTELRFLPELMQSDKLVTPTGVGYGMCQGFTKKSYTGRNTPGQHESCCEWIVRIRGASEPGFRNEFSYYKGIQTTKLSRDSAARTHKCATLLASLLQNKSKNPGSLRLKLSSL
jgi:hypothetical protein